MNESGASAKLGPDGERILPGEGLCGRGPEQSFRRYPTSPKDDAEEDFARDQTKPNICPV